MSDVTNTISYNIELDNITTRIEYDGEIIRGDSSLVINAIITRTSVAEDLSTSTVTAYAVRSDKTSVLLETTVTVNEVDIQLNTTSTSKSGRLVILLKIVDSSSIVLTPLIVDCKVSQGSTDTILDPSNLWSVDEIIALLDDITEIATVGIGIADNNLVQMDDTDAVDNDYAKFTVNGLEGRSYTELRSDINVENGADVTDSENVNAAGAVMESDYNANTILAATTDNTPVPVTISEQSVVGRATSGNIAALAIDSVLSSEPASHNTLPSAKIVHQKLAAKANQTLTDAGGYYTVKTPEGALQEVGSQLADIATTTKNLANIENIQIGKSWNTSANADRAVLYIPVEPSTKYCVSFGSHTFDAIYWVEKETEAATTAVYSTSITSGYNRTTSATTHFLCIGFNKTAISLSAFVGLDLQVELGAIETPYIQYRTAEDLYIRTYGITHVTPEMYGAYGDGVKDDTVALQAALDTGKDVIARGNYKITASLQMTPVYEYGQRFDFRRIVYSGTGHALRFNGRNGIVSGAYLYSTAGSCVAIGDASLTYNWSIDINFMRSDAGVGYTIGGPEEVSEISIRGTRIIYWTLGVYMDITQDFVGQISFEGMAINTENASGGYAFLTNAANGNGMTGLTLINVSLEGAMGGFNFVNSNISQPIQRLECFGLRTSELTVVDGYNLLRLTGNGIMSGNIFTDICDLGKIDTSLHEPDLTLAQCICIYGRLTYKGIGWRKATIVGKWIFPEINAGYEESSNVTYDDSNFPSKVCKISGTCAFTLTFPFDGELTFVAGASSTTITINGVLYTLTSSGDTLIVKTMPTQTSIQIIITNGTQTTVTTLS